jgi:hypothetical protein
MNYDRTPLSKEMMEPAASQEGDRWRYDTMDKSTQAERSIAISLKRIADMMEKHYGSR